MERQLREAHRCQEAGDLAEAERLYAKVLAADPNHAEAWYLMGYLDILNGRPQSALERMERAVSLKPDLTEAHVNRGAILAELGRNDEAIAAWHVALAQDPDFTTAHQNLAALLRKLGRTAEAVPHMLANAEGKHSAEIYLQGARLAGAENMIGIARMAAEAAIAIDPRLTAAHIIRASQACRMGHLVEAEQAARQAIKIEAAGAESHAVLGQVHFAADRRAEAAISFAQAMTLAPENIHYRYYHALATGINDLEARSIFTTDLFDAFADTFNDVLVNELAYDARNTIAMELKKSRCVD